MNSYSFTFTIPYSKKVYFNGKRRTFGAMTQDYQHKFLCHHMTNIIFSQYYKYIDYIFEEHEDKRLHIHGYAVIETPDSLSIIKELVHNFYTLNRAVGIAPSVYPRLSNLQQTITDISHWEAYINKNQDTMKFLSPMRQQEKEVEQLDIKPIVKIEHRPSTPPSEYYATYAFGKQKQNFLVEL